MRDNGWTWAAASNASLLDADKSRLTHGKSIIDMLWDELDTVVQRIMSEDGAAEDGRDPGRAEGIATALSILLNPYAPSLPEIREQAMQRYHNAEAGTIPQSIRPRPKRKSASGH